MNKAHPKLGELPASAICGNSFAGTKEQTSISRRPLATSASIQRNFCAVGIVAFVRNIAIERDRADSALVIAQQERERRDGEHC